MEDKILDFDLPLVEEGESSISEDDYIPFQSVEDLQDYVEPTKVVEPVRIQPRPSTTAPADSTRRRQVESCLRDERIIVRYIPRETGLVTDPRHFLYGGMAETAKMTLTVPYMARSQTYVNVLTNDEKDYLEEIMGLEYNRLSVYLKENNYWDNYQVVLEKGDNPLNLALPDDYIKYKVLVANKDLIAPSLQVLQDSPKETYKFVIVREVEETSIANEYLTSTMEAYMEFGKVQSEADILRLVIETLTSKPIAANTKLDVLIAQSAKLIQASPLLFLRAVKDPFLRTKVLLRKAVDYGIIGRRGDEFYLKSDNSPLCNIDERPTLNNAVKYLNAPKNQELRLSIEATINSLKE